MKVLTVIFKTLHYYHFEFNIQTEETRYLHSNQLHLIQDRFGLNNALSIQQRPVKRRLDLDWNSPSKSMCIDGSGTSPRVQLPISTWVIEPQSSTSSMTQRGKCASAVSSSNSSASGNAAPYRAISFRCKKWSRQLQARIGHSSNSWTTQTSSTTLNKDAENEENGKAQSARADVPNN